MFRTLVKKFYSKPFYHLLDWLKLLCEIFRKAILQKPFIGLPLVFFVSFLSFMLIIPNLHKCSEKHLMDLTYYVLIVLIFDLHSSMIIVYWLFFFFLKKKGAPVTPKIFNKSMCNLKAVTFKKIVSLNSINHT